MARPIKSGMDYFPHDTDAGSDEKIEMLMLAHGLAGHGFYFFLCERIYRTDNGELNVSAAETRQLLSRKLFITIQEFDSMLETALKAGCFDRNEYDGKGVLTSNGIKKRYDIVNCKRLNNRSKKVSATETRQKPDSNSTETPESKGKKSKGKERKVKTDIPENFSLSERVLKWASEKGYVRLNDHLESFKAKVAANGYKYVDWDSAFMEAIRQDWAKLNGGPNGKAGNGIKRIDGPKATPGKYDGLGITLNNDA